MVKIQQKSNGQYVVTIDKKLAEAMNLAGAEAEWNLVSRNALELRVTERADNDD